MLGLKNQFIMAPVKLGYGDGSGKVNDRHIDVYLERCNGLAAVTPEPMYLDRGLRELPTQIGIDNDDKLPGLVRLTEVVHRAGAKVIAHLNHPGRMANPNIPGNYFLSASDKPCENGGATPGRMNESDMRDARRLFVEASVRAERAGFDIIELQMGHGYLLSQFISPAVNDRDDEYGGSLPQRLRFPLEVLDDVMAAVNLPLIVRISGDEMIPGGFHIDDMIELAKILQERGVSAIHVSAGSVCSTPPWYFQHMFVPKGKTWDLAARIKEEVSIPVIFVGRVHSALDVQTLRKEYHAEYIALGRALFADPDFIRKILGEMPDAVRPCLACSEGCLGGVKSGKGLQCVVNPLLGTGLSPVTRAKEHKRFAVVGGGLAGMQAALTLTDRGHEVVLYEENKLGGQFQLASLPPGKRSMHEIIDFYTQELSRRSVSIRYERAEADLLLRGEYDAVILASGARPAVPVIKGLTGYHWAEWLADKDFPEKTKVVVIGGGLIGIEMASKLVEHKNEVIVVELLDNVAVGMEMIEAKMTLAKLKKQNVAIYTGHQVREIDGETVVLSVSGDAGTSASGRSADVVIEGVQEIVVAAGMRTYHPLKEELEGRIPLYLIGDARSVGKAQDAVRDGYETASAL